MPPRCREFPSAEERPMAYSSPPDCIIGRADPVLGWPNRLSTYLLSPLDPIWASLMTE